MFFNLPFRRDNRPQIDTVYINEVVVTLEENGQPTAPFLRNYSVIMAGDVAFAEVLGKP